MIKLDKVNFGYSRRKQLFSEIGFELPMGSVVGLLGRNGEGKSTLMKLISGQLLASSGSIEVFGKNPKERPVGLLRELYYLPEEVQMPSISIREYFDCYAPFYPTYDQRIADSLMGEFDINWGMNLGKISLGQKKKAAIALALSLRVPLLLMDEPTNGLDIPSKSIFRRVVARYTSPEQMIIISTHQVRDLEQLIDHLLLLDGNRIIANYSIDHILRHLSFASTTPQSRSEALYVEPSIMGELGVFARRDDEAEGNFSMELFFNAMVAERSRMLAALEVK